MSAVGDLPADIRVLSRLINGCKDDVPGMNAKVSLVKSFIATGGKDLLDVICWLHLESSITIHTSALLKLITWGKREIAATTPLSSSSETARSGVTGKDAADPSSMLVASMLSSCEAADMAGIVDKFIGANPQVGVVGIVRYLNRRGFVKVDASSLLAASAIDWQKPRAMQPSPPWRQIWEGEVPSGPPRHARIRDTRGLKATVTFLCSATDAAATSSSTAQQLLEAWQMPPPSMCIYPDAGSVHPRQADSAGVLCNLPQLAEWVATSDDQQHAKGSVFGRVLAPPADGDAEEVADEVVASASRETELTHTSVEAWQTEVHARKDDMIKASRSVNTLIYAKLKEVFSALLHTAAESGAWIIVDRTNEAASAAAEIILEVVLERELDVPVIVAIDSLERLGRARKDTRSHAIVRRLQELFDSVEGSSHISNMEKELLPFDFMYSVTEFDEPSTYASHDDAAIPFEVLDEHKAGGGSEQCDPMHKWCVYIPIHSASFSSPSI